MLNKKTVGGLILLVMSLTTIAQTTNPTPTPTSSTQTSIEGEVKNALDTITPAQTSALNKRWEEARASNNTLTITLYRPSYVLPYYYTKDPDYAVYVNNTPNDQQIKNSEFKAQLSFYVPVIRNLFYDPNKTLLIAYTQLNYWQVYASSQYFRETNYEPEIMVEHHFHPNWLFRFGVNHQSNGRGGDLERSWNRIIETLQLSGEKWLASVSVWQLIFKNQSSNLHNPEIAHYLGYDSILFSYKIKEVRASVQIQNIESALTRGSITGTLSYPVTEHISIYGQYFNGYGQSLIEYNHRTQAFGVGVAFNDWI